MADLKFDINTDINLVIYGLEGILFKNTVSAITSVNEMGKFDILPRHSNFISIVRDFIILHQKDGSTKEFKLKEGVLKLTSNQADIFLGLEGLKE